MSTLRVARTLTVLLLAGCAARAPAADAPARATLVLMGTTDVHARLMPWDYDARSATSGGLALLAPVVDSIRRAHPGRTLLVDSGDLLQGSAMAAAYTPLEPGDEHPVITGMNLMGYDAAALGNHEFNFGIDHLDQVIAAADFPFLSANVIRVDTGEPAYTPWVMLTRTVDGHPIRIGVTAVLPPGVAVWDRDHVEGRLEFPDMVDRLRVVVPEMRAAGADLVVVAAHSSFEGSSYDIVATGLGAENRMADAARLVPGIDVVFLGHSHRELADSTLADVLFLQAGPRASSLAVATVELVRRGDGWEVAARRGELVRPDPERADPAMTAALADAHERALALSNRVIGYSPVVWPAAESRVRDGALLDFVNAVQKRVTGAQLSAAAAFSLRAGIPAGEIRVGDLARLYPYDNNLLRAVRISGAELRAYLEHSARYFLPCPDGACERLVNPDWPGFNFDVIAGVDYELDLTRPIGERVTRLEFDGAPVRDEQSFTLALNNYRQGGGGGFPAVATAEVVYEGTESVRSLLIAEIEERGVVRPEDYFTENWRIVPEAWLARALREMTTGGGVRRGGPAGDTLHLRVLHTNDVHGRLDPQEIDGRGIGGAAALAAHLDSARVRFRGPSVLVDAGDVMQGTAVSNLSWGRAAIEVFNALGYDGVAVGNHEFDWGQDTLRVRIAESRFPWLAANLFEAGTGRHPDWVRPWVMVERDGVRVAIIGLALALTPDVVMAGMTEGLEFGEEWAAIDRYVPAARAAGADFVVVTGHVGAVCEAAGAQPEAPSAGCSGRILDQLERAAERPDLVVAGHTHLRNFTDVHGVPVMQAIRYTRAFGVTDLRRDPDGTVTAVHRSIRRPWADEVDADTGVARLVGEWRERVRPRLERVVAELARPLSNHDRAPVEHPLGNLIADAQRAATGAHLAIVNNGSIRRGLPAGLITWGELFELQPFQNEIVTLTLKGDRLRAALEHALDPEGRPWAHLSGVSVRYRRDAPAGERVTRIELDDGRVVGDQDEITVAVTEFLARGGDGFAMLVPVGIGRTGVLDLDALIQHLEALDAPVEGPGVGRWRP